MTVDNQTKQVDELMVKIYNTGLDIRKEVKAKLLKLLAQAEARGRELEAEGCLNHPNKVNVEASLREMEKQG